MVTIGNLMILNRRRPMNQREVVTESTPVTSQTPLEGGGVQFHWRPSVERRLYRVYVNGRLEVLTYDPWVNFQAGDLRPGARVEVHVEVRDRRLPGAPPRGPRMAGGARGRQG